MREEEKKHRDDMENWVQSHCIISFSVIWLYDQCTTFTFGQTQNCNLKKLKAYGTNLNARSIAIKFCSANIFNVIFTLFDAPITVEKCKH